jgi:hypothetical protein
MATLVIHAPKAMAVQEQKRSFGSTFSSNIGDGYAIAAPLFARLHPSCTVVLLSKDEKRRAEGTLVRLVATSKTKTGMQRYDVHFKDMKEVDYKPERLGRTGVAVI